MPGTQVKLLIVDDEPVIRLTLSQIFIEYGHAVQSAEDGFAALSLIRQDQPDIILSDLNMPRMSGFELLSVIQRRFPMMKVIAMSGAFASDTVPPGIAADAFYQKGSAVGTLMKIVEGMVRMQEMPSRQPTGKSTPMTPMTPIWINGNGHDNTGAAYVMISCPECMRTFPQTLGKASSLIHETSCIHCFSLIHFAIVQSLEPLLPKSIQRISGDQLAMPVSAS